nr:hypothetical protein I308_03163 [Cryptococcus tetragattii IND107]
MMVQSNLWPLTVLPYLLYAIVKRVAPPLPIRIHSKVKPKHRGNLKKE